ncbi:MAG: hypothetical protein J6J27_01660 [Alphaproteobacteria bacterium]|nr:hypothetical protein [Alphaproteobacteria bacterium]
MKTKKQRMIADITNFKQVLCDVKNSNNATLVNEVSYIYLDITLNIIQEINIYLNQLKTNKDLTIDNIITPLEDSIKLYINFQKQVTTLSQKQISNIRSVISYDSSRIGTRKLIKNIAPSLFQDIKEDEFIETFEKYYEYVENFYAEVKNQQSQKKEVVTRTQAEIYSITR